MARPRFTGQGFTNPIDSLGFNAESRHRAMPPISRAFMSNESRIFNSGASVFVKAGAKEIAEEAFEQAAKEGMTVAQEQALKQAIEEATIQAGEVAYKKALQEGGEEAAEAAAEQAMKEAAQDSATKGVADVAKDVTVKEGADVAKDKMKLSFAQKGGLTAAGVLAGGAVFTLAGLLGSQALSDFMEDFAGLNCDEKALDAGLDEGTDEFTEFVEECQDKAATRMTILGITGIAVVGGVIFLLLK